MEDVVGDRWHRARAMTPVHWRHVRVLDDDKGKFSVVSYYVCSRFGPLALAALGQPPNTATEGLSKAAALSLGEKLENRLAQMNNGEGRTRRGK